MQGDFRALQQLLSSQISEGTVWYVPLTPRRTTSQHCGNGPDGSQLLVPCIPPSHRRNRLSSRGQLPPYSSQNLRVRQTVSMYPSALTEWRGRSKAPYQEPGLLEHSVFMECFTCEFDVSFFVQEDAAA